MGIKLVKCRAVVPAAEAGGTGREYFFLAPKGTYTGGVSIATGIDEASDDEQDEPNTAVKELLLVGVLERIHVRAEKAGKRYILKLLAREDKADTVEDDLKDKAVNTDGTVSGGAIVKRIINPRRAHTY